MDKNIQRFPISSWKRTLNRRGKRSVSCIVSDRWLRFGEPDQQALNIGTPILLDVMTETLDEKDEFKSKSKKLCSLFVTVEQLKKLLEEIDP